MSSVETLGALERRLNASIPQQQLLGEVAARIKRIGRTAKVPGFRPGKVPFKILEQQGSYDLAIDTLLNYLRDLNPKTDSARIASFREKIRKDIPLLPSDKQKEYRIKDSMLFMKKASDSLALNQNPG